MVRAVDDGRHICLLFILLAASPGSSRRRPYVVPAASAAVPAPRVALPAVAGGGGLALGGRRSGHALRRAGELRRNSLPRFSLLFPALLLRGERPAVTGKRQSHAARARARSFVTPRHATLERERLSDREVDAAPEQVSVATQRTLPDEAALRSWLLEHGVDFSTWGQGKTRDVGELLEEVRLNESSLEVWRTKSGELQPLRVIHVLKAKVASMDSRKRGVFLFNTWQQFADGRLRTRNSLLTEKMLPAEVPLESNLQEACSRAVSEELQSVVKPSFQMGPDTHAPVFNPDDGCPVQVINRTLLSVSVETEESRSYPNLLTRYNVYTVEVVCAGLPSANFNSIEYDQDEYGKWRPKYVHAWVWLPWFQIKHLERDIQTSLDPTEEELDEMLTQGIDGFSPRSEHIPLALPEDWDMTAAYNYNTYGPEVVDVN